MRWLLAGVLAVALAAGSWAVVIRHRAQAAPRPVETAAVATAKIERRDLSTTRSLSGTIGYGAARPLSGHTEATVTWLPAVGTTIKRGKQLFRADDRPVTLFYGSMPLYRPIAGANMTGRDVLIVADNLSALGYRVGRQPSSGLLGPQLVAAIKRWQKDLEVPVTGTIAVGDVEVLSGAVRVDSIAVQPGSPANAPLMSVTSTRKVVTVGAELSDAASIERGDHVTVGLPDQRTAKARVTAVGRNLAAEADGPPKLSVTVTVDDPAAIAKLDSAEVEVAFAGRTVKGVLAVPVESLVALAEGGYAVEVAGSLVAVHTGMFADGWVEVSGSGLTEGTSVVVSS